MTPDWSFGIQDDNMQLAVNEARAKGAQVVAVLSHNGMDVDLKMAGRVSGIDAILGGHTHDGVPAPILVKNAGGQTLVTNAGCSGKFLGVMDFDVRNGKVADIRYKLMPVFANLIAPDAEMETLSRMCVHRMRRRWRKTRRSPRARYTAAATSMAPLTS